MRLCCPVYASARTLVLLSAALTGILAERGVSISPLSVPGCRLALCEISNQVAWGVVALPLTLSEFELWAVFAAPITRSQP